VTRALIGGCCLVAASLVGSRPLAAQDRRAALIASAKDEVDPAKRIQLLANALDPAKGPPGGVWSDGVQALAQALIDNGQDSTAALWLRWAVRLSPTLEPDTIQYTPQVSNALHAARQFVNQSITAGDSVTATTWLWSPATADRGASRIQIERAAKLAIRVTVDGGVPLAAGSGVDVAPGSHEIAASAAGYDSARITREALPGTTMELRFGLRRARQAATSRPTPSASATQFPKTSHRGFPWKLALIGAAVVGTAAVAVLVLH